MEKGWGGLRLSRWGGGGQGGEHGIVGVQEVHGSSPGIAEGGAVIYHKVHVGLGDVDEQLIGGINVENVILLDCCQEPVGEGPDEMVKRRRWREFVGSWRDLDGITAA